MPVRNNVLTLLFCIIKYKISASTHQTSDIRIDFLYMTPEKTSHNISNTILLLSIVAIAAVFLPFNCISFYFISTFFVVVLFVLCLLQFQRQRYKFQGNNKKKASKIFWHLAHKSNTLCFRICIICSFFLNGSGPFEQNAFWKSAVYDF